MNSPATAMTLLKLSASSLIVATALAGCGSANYAQRPKSAGVTVDITSRLANKMAEQSARAMAAGDYAQAVDMAQRAVAGAPEDAGYRTQLAQAYLRAGRFLSADQAFADVIHLMPDNDKARVGQAVARVAQGDRAGARAALAEVRNAPADDYGLALALAGDTVRAVEVLEPAARGMRGTSRTRQNLALAYALDGQWAKARTVAAQDVSPADLDRRMENWARLASPEARDMQVASLLGATPAAGDPGQPQMLALSRPANAAEAPVEMASAEPMLADVATASQVAAASTEVAITAPVEPVATISPVDVPASAVPLAPAASAVSASVVETSSVPETAPLPDTAPAPQAVAATAETPIPVTPVQPEPKPAVVTSVAVKRVAFEPAPLEKPIQPGGEWFVQLAAYKSARWMEPGWVHLTDNFKRLAQYAPSHSVYTVSATGAVFHRLSVGGFDGYADAASLCRSLRQQGADCFVRREGGDRPMQMAGGKRQQLAGL